MNKPEIRTMQYVSLGQALDYFQHKTGIDLRDITNTGNRLTAINIADYMDMYPEFISGASISGYVVVERGEEYGLPEKYLNLVEDFEKFFREEFESETQVFNDL